MWGALALNHILAGNIKYDPLKEFTLSIFLQTRCASFTETMKYFVSLQSIFTVW